MTDKKPTGKIVKGFGVAPKSWKKLKLVKIEEPIYDYDKIYWVNTVPCPMLEQYVHPSECEACDYGKLGSYEEQWTVCSYNCLHPRRKNNGKTS